MIRARTVLVPRPYGLGATVAVETVREHGDDPLPFLRMIAHWQTVGGGEPFIPANHDGRIVTVGRDWGWEPDPFAELVA